MTVEQVMTRRDLSLAPWNTISEAAAIMRDHDVAALPVVFGDRPVGLLTERDIVTRILPQAPDAGCRPVSDAMSRHPVSCFADQDVEEAAVIMGDKQIRQLVILDRSGGLVGVLSVEDIAENASEELAGQTLGEIVEKRA